MSINKNVNNRKETQPQLWFSIFPSYSIGTLVRFDFCKCVFASFQVFLDSLHTVFTKRGMREGFIFHAPCTYNRQKRRVSQHQGPKKAPGTTSLPWSEEDFSTFAQVQQFLEIRSVWQFFVLVARPLNDFMPGSTTYTYPDT